MRLLLRVYRYNADRDAVLGKASTSDVPLWKLAAVKEIAQDVCVSSGGDARAAPVMPPHPEPQGFKYLDELRRRELIAQETSKQASSSSTTRTAKKRRNMEPSQVPRRAPQSDAEICLAGALVGAEMAKSTNSTEVYDKAAQAYNGLYLNEGASPSAPTSAKLLKDFFTQREKERVLADTCGPPISPAVQAVADQPEPGVTPQATPALAVAGPSVAPPGRKPSAAPPGRKRRPATDAENAASKRRVKNRINVR